MDHGKIVTLYPQRETRTAASHPPPTRIWHPSVYFGGRMNGCRQCEDWRNVIGFRGFDDLLDGVDEEVPVEPGTIIQFRNFAYSGPFAIDTASGHATGHADDPGNRGRVWDLDRHQIARCDLFIAYLEDLQAFGTLVEIGYAAALGKPIALGFSDQMPEEDFEELWFARMAAWKIYHGSAKQFWRLVREDWIAKPDCPEDM